MRKMLARAAVATIAAALLVPAGAVASAQAVAPAHTASVDDLADGVRRQLAAGVQVAPKAAAAGTAKAAPAGAANPYRGMVPDPTTVDYSYWSQQAKAGSAQRAAARARAAGANAALASPLLHDEAEPAGFFGANDTHATAELVKGFGTGPRKNNRSRILGQLSPEPVTISSLTPFAEDDGSIPLAADPLITSARRGAKITGAVIGDGPHGSTGTGSGDFDFLKLTALAGQQLIVDTDTPTGPLDTVVAVYDAAGNILATNDDATGLDSFLAFQFTAAGTYYVLVSGFGSGTVFPADPFDSGSGLGAGSEGPYDVTVTVSFPDIDTFAVDLLPGDVVGGSVTGNGSRLVIRDETGREVFGSDQDFSVLYSPNAPLPGGGNAVVDYVASRAGRHSVQVTGTAGLYDITFEAYRPGPEAQQSGVVQRLFLDFDGQRVNTGIWGGPGVRDLSPLAGFLGRWGLSAADENAVINATIAAVRENIRADSIERGTNPRFGVQILNSRDHPNAYGQPNTHRVIVGGTIAELGISTIGIAQYIDPGNYSLDDSAVVLLDIMSNPTGAASLNTYITPASDKIRFIGRALANVVTHEAGHLYGSWHTDTFNTVPNLMDAGGNFPGLFGVGPDRIGGTADDVDYDFGEDTLFPAEGFTGTEDTLNICAWALTRGRRR